MSENCESTEKKIKRVTAVGLVANLILTIFKIVAGYFGNSQTVIADGIHSLSDSVTDIAVIVGSSFWSAPPDEEHPHGHKRIETFITAVIGIALFAVAFGNNFLDIGLFANGIRKVGITVSGFCKQFVL